MATIEDCVKLLIYVKQLRYFALWELTRIFFELMVAKCFYLSGVLFPGFGYGKPKCAGVYHNLTFTRGTLKLRFEAYLVLYE